MMTVQDDIDFMEFLHKQELAKKDAMIADKDAVIAEKDAEIADKDAALADKDAEIARLKALVDAKN